MRCLRLTVSDEVAESFFEALYRMAGLEDEGDSNPSYFAGTSWWCLSPILVLFWRRSANQC